MIVHDQAAVRAMHGFGAFGGEYHEGDEQAAFCDSKYPWATDQKNNLRCRLITTPDWNPNTDWGRRMRGLPGEGATGSAADSVTDKQAKDAAKAAAQSAVDAAKKDQAAGKGGSQGGNSGGGGGSGIFHSTGGKTGLVLGIAAAAAAAAFFFLKK